MSNATKKTYQAAASRKHYQKIKQHQPIRSYCKDPAEKQKLIDRWKKDPKSLSRRDIWRVKQYLKKTEAIHVAQQPPQQQSDSPYHKQEDVHVEAENEKNEDPALQIERKYGQGMFLFIFHVSQRHACI